MKYRPHVLGVQSGRSWPFNSGIQADSVCQESSRRKDALVRRLGVLHLGRVHLGWCNVSWCSRRCEYRCSASRTRAVYLDPFVVAPVLSLALRGQVKLDGGRTARFAATPATLTRAETRKNGQWFLNGWLNAPRAAFSSTVLSILQRRTAGRILCFL